MNRAGRKQTHVKGQNVKSPLHGFFCKVRVAFAVKISYGNYSPHLKLASWGLDICPQHLLNIPIVLLILSEGIF